MRILIADDDNELSMLLSEFFHSEGIEAISVTDGETAIRTLQNSKFDLLLLDVMMPKLNGIDTLKKIRDKSDLAVIMLTAKAAQVDRILGLELGADDYVIKPCDPRELLARIRAVCRRYVKNAAPQHIRVGNINIALTSREVTINERPIDLTSTEFEILSVLAKKAGEPVTRDKLSTEVLGKRLQPYDRSIDVHVSNLRKKISENNNDNTLLKTIRGSGYQLIIQPKT